MFSRIILFLLFQDRILAFYFDVGYRNKIVRSSNIFLNAEKNPFNFEIASDIQTTSDYSELPESFEDSIERAATTTANLIQLGRRCRIDFDTSVGDQTFTNLKNTLPMVKKLVGVLSSKLELHPIQSSSSNSTEEVSLVDGRNSPAEMKLLKIFFPDMGAAALARRDWKLGTQDSEVPACVRTANVLNDGINPEDKLVIILCPQYSEVDAVSRVVELCSVYDVPCVIINPSLINMDQGYGVRKFQLSNTTFYNLIFNNTMNRCEKYSKNNFKYF